MKNIKETINSKINSMAVQNMQKLFYRFDLNIHAAPSSKLVQLESEIIKCDLKKIGADISIVFVIGLMIMSVF